MASTEPKFWPTTSGILVLSTAVFILLSVAPVEPLQCYWCGPLAEQVHRSERAPSCDAALDQVTACETGFTHCAVVATYPPYIESRYCVKLYQDECYSLWCNSTRTWRMTCPCRGDLCNGHNTAREIEAFSTLTKLVYTSQSRIKRTMITTHNFINSRRNNIKNITEETKPEEVDMIENEEMQSDQAVTHIINDINSDNATIDDDDKVLSTNIVNHMKNNKQDDISDKHEDNIIDYQIITPDTVNKIKEEENTEMELHNTNIEGEITKDKVKTEIQILNSTLDTFKEIKNEEKTEIYILSTTPTTTKVIKDEENVRNTTPKITEEIKYDQNKEIGKKADNDDKTATHQFTMKPSENLPTAEALQHTVSPVEKNTEGTTLESTSTTMRATTIDVTLKPTMPGKNNSVRTQTLTVLTIIIIILLQVLII